MSFNVDVNYKLAVDNFSWDDSAAPLAIPLNDFHGLITNISEKIIAASQIRPMLEMVSSKTLSLAESCYLVVQDKDRKVENPTTVSLIQQASREEKTLLKHTVIKLSEDFIQVPPNDLKTITLLFGIQRVHDLAKGIIVDIPESRTPVEKLEADLTKLKEIRNQYDPSSLSQVEQEFLQKVDDKIEEKTKLLNTLKGSTEK